MHTDRAASLALFLSDKTGSVLKSWRGKMLAKDQRQLFGRFIGKGTIIIDGADETIRNRVKVCFGMDFNDSVVIQWRDL